MSARRKTTTPPRTPLRAYLGVWILGRPATTPVQRPAQARESSAADDRVRVALARKVREHETAVGERSARADGLGLSDRGDAFEGWDSRQRERGGRKHSCQDEGSEHVRSQL